MLSDLIIIAIERPGVFMLSYVTPALMLAYIGVSIVGLLYERKKYRRRAKEYGRIFREK